MLASTFNLAQPTMTWEENIGKGLSTLNWPVGIMGINGLMKEGPAHCEQHHSLVRGILTIEEQGGHWAQAKKQASTDVSFLFALDWTRHNGLLPAPVTFSDGPTWNFAQNPSSPNFLFVRFCFFLIAAETKLEHVTDVAGNPGWVGLPCVALRNAKQ